MIDIFKCPECGFKSNKAEVQTTEVGNVRWLNPKFDKKGVMENLGNDWVYDGGETWKGMGYLILCKKCGEVIKEIEDF